MSERSMADVFSARAHVDGMLRFEGALARAAARAGVIPRSAADAIAAACDVSGFDVDAIVREGTRAGTPVIPLVRALGERVPADARGHVHRGATSQDAIDTALVLQMREGLDLLAADLTGLCAACAALAERHRATTMAGRTLLQQAVPVTFGLKAARWLAMSVRQVRALRAVRDSALAVQLGGAAGTLAALGDRGLEVAALLGEELGLPVPELPWHAERDRVASVAAAVGVVAGAMSKIATDIVLLAQTEVGEVAEGAAEGKGGSSAMPHKRNPVDAVFAVAASRLAVGLVPVVLGAMAQEHERAAGAWQAEWTAIPDLFRHAAEAVARVRSAIEGLEVDAARMRENVALAGGAVMAESLTVALAAHVGRSEAQRMVRAAAESESLGDAARRDSRIAAALSPDELEHALDPGAYLGATDALVTRALNAYRALCEETP